jgi:hypothetical protein
MPNTCHLRGHTDAHRQLDLTLGAQGNTCRRKIFLQGPKLHTHLGCRRRSRQSNDKLCPVLSTSSSANNVRQSVGAILARVIPVTEVDKWQPQSKLQQHQQQIPSNAG